jgi:V8-like Glu-specific endopeptidase
MYEEKGKDKSMTKNSMARPRRAKQRQRARAKTQASRGAPLDPEQILQRENIEALAAMPTEIASRLATRRLLISGVRQAITAQRGDGKHGSRSGYEIVIPKNAVVGLAGRTAHRMARPRSKKASRRTVLEGFRPKWANHVYHPKRATVQAWAKRPVSAGGRTGEVYWGVFPPEDRAVYYPSGYPWQCVGRVFVWNDASAASWAWWGSAVLIGPRLVLTAGHVVPWDASSWMMRFVPGYYDGSSILGAGAESYVSDARGWDVSYYSRLPDAHDMAILRLYDPLGDWLGFFGSKPYSDSYTSHPYWNLTGYPAAIAGAERPSYQLGIAVDEADASTDALDLEHRGDSTGGDSGGPFWATWPDGFPYVIGTVSGGEVFTNSSGVVVKDTNNCAGGNAINDLIRWGRINWP